MRPGIRILLSVQLLVALTVLPCFSQQSTWQRLNDDVHLHYQKGEYKQAIKLGEKALKVAQRAYGPMDPRTATSLNNLAELLKAQGDYEHAEPLYKSALLVWEGLAASGYSADLATCLNNLASLYR